MNTKDLESALHALPYPGLSRTLGELKLISEVKVTDNHAKVELLTVSDESYLTVKTAIETEFASQFKTLDITKKSTAPKDTNYGNSAAPNNRAPYAANVIAVTSGKGGVGKSTVSVNLAIALAQQGYKVGILDADVYGPNVPRLTNTDLEKIRWNDDNQIIPCENYGIKIMSVALTTPTSDTPLVWRSSVAVSALIQFLEDVAWGELDFMVIDMPPGTGDIQLTMAQELPITAGIIVTTPQLVASDDVSRAIRMFQDIHVPIAGLVENMSYFIAPDTGTRYDIFGSGGGERLSKRYNVPLLGQIPLNMDIREGSDNGEPPVVLGSEMLKSYYKEIVKAMLESVKFRF
ncbi:Mrp/NBP35 family ATP-binding protein [Sulfuricurvum sp.]|uniref:Mrp/NBP35 family ATP-binding protein n=1 Tax=Sulfuricurvum sp. TaxID=2025608 RepID=UPI0035658287